MKKIIMTLVVICVILSVPAQAARISTTGGKITSVADSDRFTQSEISRSNIALKNFIENNSKFILEDFKKMIMTITPARANKFFCDNKELIAECGDFLKTENGGIMVKYDSEKTSDKYCYWEEKASEHGWSLLATPPEGCEVIERLRVKLLEARLIEEDIHFGAGYNSEGNSEYFYIFFRPYAGTYGGLDNSLVCSNDPTIEIEEQHVYKDFYLEYNAGRGDRNAAW